jgi:methionyl-tRNA formyltransferase
MNKEDLRIVYMGTPEFAVAPLKRLVEEKYTIAGVITVADKPAGRGQKVRQSPVKVYAEEQGLKVLQPTNLKDEAFLAELKALNANLQIVVAFRMLPEQVWKMPELGTFNLHASLLPNYRGAAPINWAIINGEEYSGISTFFLQQEIDTGNILLQKKVKIEKEDNAGSLHDKLMLEGSLLVTETLERLLKGDLRPIPQSELLSDMESVKMAPKIFREDCKIDFSKSANEVYDFIRGLSPYPAAFTEIRLQNGEVKNIKVFKTEILPLKGEAGSVRQIDNKLVAFTKDAALSILELQMEGKKKMGIEEFLRGNKIA